MHTTRKVAYLVGAFFGIAAAIAVVANETRLAQFLIALTLPSICIGTMLSARAIHQQVRASQRDMARQLRSNHDDEADRNNATDAALRKISRRLARYELAIADLSGELSAMKTLVAHEAGAASSHGAALLDSIGRNSEQLKQLDRVLAMAYRRTVNLTTAVEQLPSEILDVTDLSALGIRSTVRMPTLGGWAATAGTIRALIDEILRNDEHPTVLECGSGTSTVWIASALRARGGGRVISLEHDEQFARQTVAELQRHGLEDYADVRTAPLEPLPTDAERVWYSTAALADLPMINVLFVDGPPGDAQVSVRETAYPILAERLVNGALVVLDDTNRPDEQAIVTSWTSSTLSSRELRLESRLARATLMRVHLT